MFVIPKSGLIVRDPQTFASLPVEGREVPESEYWLRRLADGDVVAKADDAAAVSAPVGAKTKKTP
ncbi:DUF2635 domain-containing protein [Paracraurococcus lichenis]|uniref:DUF2635 domain-containing protein n=1 Tax=Paracraurococcus lichenis TaxID=3064888 RepID=A0ABT9EDM2_9PROT|nr:DUF2635 domain-containing protein [Paracraurococcus sp. LOR1-02]MDO9714301.1 DUF2635 domain-containing protein [Paracraurococcus sp. LOR1-02]